SSAGAEVDGAYAEQLLTLVEQHLPRIDATIAEVATAFPVEQMAKVDKAILRLAIAELLFDNRVPEKVVTPEATRLAELYGGERAPRFVHGVLSTIAGFTKRP
ncbi:MAG: N utilization substance protein B, partial [Dehalococcoidia bacterium]|nr:N utilization substance protein B [Dehalococcoidia bacterium]